MNSSSSSAMDAEDAVDDTRSSLPTPTSENANNCIGEISSSDDDNEEKSATDEDDLEMSAGPASIEDRAYLAHSDALKKLLEKEGQVNFLPGWTIDDITGLLIQLSKHTHEERGLKLIAKNFRETSIEEIAECIENCKKINARACQERFRYNEIISKKVANETGTSQPEVNKIQPFPNWIAFAKHVKRMKGIGDDSQQAVISKFLNNCADNATKIMKKEGNLPDYSKIYKHLAAMSEGYSLKGLQGMDAAVILDIFEQMERDVSTMPDELKGFIKKMFRDIQSLPLDDFKLNDDVKEENAEEIMNLLDFPFDTSQFDVASILAAQKRAE